MTRSRQPRSTLRNRLALGAVLVALTSALPGMASAATGDRDAKGVSDTTVPAAERSLRRILQSDSEDATLVDTGPRPQGYPDPRRPDEIPRDPGQLERGQKLVTVSTIPPLAGIVVDLDDQRATTDQTGVAEFITDSGADLNERLTVITRETRDGDLYRANYSRIYRISSDHVQLAFDVHRPMTFSFVGVNGETIDHERTQSTNLKNSIGGRVADIPLDEPVWVFSERVVSWSTGPELRDIEWSIDSVMVRDTNVVNRAQVRFLPRERAHIQIPVLFFSATFEVHDMFFGFPQGDTVELTYPDGEIIFHELDENGVLMLPSLPRGEYGVMLDGAGPRIARPVVLSRNQDVRLAFLSWLNIGIVGGVGLFFMIVPVIFGRSLLRRRNSSRSSGLELPAVDEALPYNDFVDRWDVEPEPRPKASTDWFNSDETLDFDTLESQRTWQEFQALSAAVSTKPSREDEE